MKDCGKTLYIICITIILLIFIICCTIVSLNQKSNTLHSNEYFSNDIPCQVVKVFDKETGVYYYITSAGDIEVAVDVYGRPLIVDGGNGTAPFDMVRGANPYAAQQ